MALIICVFVQSHFAFSFILTQMSFWALVFP